MDKPDQYKKIIWDLWTSGESKLGKLIITPGRAAKPKGFYNSDGVKQISGIDWTSMASLRNSSNAVLSYNSPGDATSAITLGDLDTWFFEAGYQQIFSNRSLFASSNFNDLLELSNYASDSRNRVVTLINASILYEGADTLISLKNHWIVWTGVPLVKSTGKPVTKQTDKQELITLELFSWGQIFSQLNSNTTLDKFLSHLFGGRVFRL